MAFIYDLTDTWNAGGTTFNAIKMNVTDTASAAASKLITVQVSGTEKFSVQKDGFTDVNGNVRLSAANPVIELNTGGPQIYVPAANTFALATGGGIGSPVERFRVDASGSVGIGTSSPSARLHTVSTSGFTAPTLLCSDTVGAFRVVFNPSTYAGVPANKPWLHSYEDIYIGSDAGTSFNVMSGGANNLTVTSGGNVGIGTTSPSDKLNISSSSNQIGLDTGDQATYGTLDLGHFTNGAFIGTQAGSNSASDLLRFGTSGTERLRITSAGSVGIGVTAPSSKLEVAGVVRIKDANADTNGLNLSSDAGGIGYINAGYATVGTLVFQTQSVERGRISSDGQWRWGDTATIDTVSYLPFQITNGIAINTTSTSPQSAMSFFNGQGSGTRVGWIGTNGSATSYNTSSDQRLKENIADADDAGALIDTIQVRQFDWRLNGEHQAYGMVAQELDNVYPDAVSHGPTEDDMMAVDYSKLVPMLVKEIQSLRARVAQLEG